MYSINIILPETEVRGILLDRAEGEVYMNNKISMTEVEGSILVEYHQVTMVHMLYTLVWGQIFSEIC